MLIYFIYKSKIYLLTNFFNFYLDLFDKKNKSTKK